MVQNFIRFFTKKHSEWKHIVCKKYSFFELKDRKIVTQTEPDQLTIPLNKLPWIRASAILSELSNSLNFGLLSIIFCSLGLTWGSLNFTTISNSSCNSSKLPDDSRRASLHLKIRVSNTYKGIIAILIEKTIALPFCLLI